MRRNLILLVLSVAACAFAAGCQATRKVGKAAVAIPFFVADGLINGLLDSDETIIEQDRREKRERQWKQHWRDHPDDNRAMHEAFKGDYE